MFSRLPIKRSHTLRRLCIWLLAVLLPVQGTLAAVLMTAGPAHVHIQPASAASAVLVDFRRVLPEVAPRPVHVFTAFGHFHRGTPVQRHYHPSTDASVVPMGDGHMAAAAGDEWSVSPSLLAFVALIGTPAAPGAADPVHPLSQRPAWSFLTHHPAFPERPPQAA